MSLAGQWDAVNGKVLRCPTVAVCTLLGLERLASGGSNGAAD